MDPTTATYPKPAKMPESTLKPWEVTHNSKIETCSMISRGPIAQCQRI